MEDNTNNEKVFHASRLEKLILLKCPFSNQSNLQINAVPIKIPMGFFTVLNKYNYKICMESEKIPNNKAILTKKSKARDIMSRISKSYHKVIVIQLYGTGIKYLVLIKNFLIYQSSFPYLFSLVCLFLIVNGETLSTYYNHRVFPGIKYIIYNLAPQRI